MNPPLDTNQKKIAKILAGYGFDEIQFIQPWAGNDSLTVRYKYWQEITGAEVLIEVQYLYPNSYKNSEEKDDQQPIHTLVLNK